METAVVREEQLIELPNQQVLFNDEQPKQVLVKDGPSEQEQIQKSPKIELTIQKHKSKNQIKREARLAQRKDQRKELRQKERERRKERGIVNLAVKTNIATGETVKFHRKQLKNNKMVESKCKLRLTIDCSFENMMSDSDISHLAKQLSYSYAKNRRMEAPLQFYLTSCEMKTDEILEKSGLSNWDVHLHKEHYLHVFRDVRKEDICYLTSDSPNIIEEFDENKVYIIGGLGSCLFII